MPGVWPRLPFLPVSRLRVLLRSPRGRLRLRGDPRAHQPRAHRGRSPSRSGATPICCRSTWWTASRRSAPRWASRRWCARATWRPSGASGSSTSRTTRSRHPTCSFKDRVVAMAIGKAREFGFDTVACASTGNLANSVAAHAAEARLASYIFIPADLEQGKVIATLIYDPTVIEVQGTYDEVNRLCSEVGDQLPLGLREHQPAAVLRGGLEDVRLRDRRAARLARPRPRGGALRGRLAPHQDRQGDAGAGACSG